MDSLQSGYVQRGKDCLPRQGSAAPWQVTMHYGKDKKALLDQPIEDGCLEFLGERGEEHHQTSFISLQKSYGEHAA